MKKIILDYATWRCGQRGPNQLGKGNTMLVNDEGLMCCLGQFTPQFNPEITEKDMAGRGYPSELLKDVPLLARDGFRNTDLANDAVTINDNESTTPLEKIARLKELFLKSDCEIEVINLPIK